MRPHRSNSFCPCGKNIADAHDQGCKKTGPEKICDLISQTLKVQVKNNSCTGQEMVLSAKLGQVIIASRDDEEGRARWILQCRTNARRHQHKKIFGDVLNT